MPWSLLSRMRLESLPGNIPNKGPLEHDIWSPKSKPVATPMDCNTEPPQTLYQPDGAEEEVSVGSQVAHVRNARNEA